MPILNKNTLKSFFETGDKPTQAQFAALIDSNLNLEDDHYLLGLRAYSPPQAYLIGDSVIYNGAIYECTTNTTGTFNPLYWNKIAGSVPGAVIYKGTWDANMNVPNLLTAPVTSGEYYVVSNAGNTSLDGITDWNVGDWAIYNGTAWGKVDNTDMVSDGENVSGTGIGIFKTKSGTLLQFKKVASTDGSIVVTEDGSNSQINFGVSFDDAGVSALRTWSAQKISNMLSGKADKVSGATAGSFASLSATGNLVDSRLSASSFLAASTRASGIPSDTFGTVTARDVQSALAQIFAQREPANSNIQSHISDLDNPHEVTNTQIGLGNVTNDKQLSLKNYAAASSEQRSSALSPSYSRALTFDYTPSIAGDYFIEWYFEMAKNSSVVTTLAARVLLNGTPITTITPRYTTNDNYTSFSGFKLESLDTILNTITVEFARETGDSGDALIREIRVRIIYT